MELMAWKGPKWTSGPLAHGNRQVHSGRFACSRAFNPDGQRIHMIGRHEGGCSLSAHLLPFQHLQGTPA